MESRRSKMPVPWVSGGVTLVGALIAVAGHVVAGFEIGGIGGGPDIGGGFVVVFGYLVALVGLATALINLSVALIARKSGGLHRNPH